VTLCATSVRLCVPFLCALCLLCGLEACSPAKPPAPPARANVLLITIDTLRADRVRPDLTPAIESVAARGVRYANARATVPLTLPSHVSIMTGALPPDHGVRVNGVVMPVRPTLARTFKDAGYRTGGFVGAYVLDRRFGLSGGFDTYDDRVPRDASGAARLEAERRGDVVTTAALEWLARTAAEPFFAWLHLYDPHAPYDPPQEWLTQAGGRAYEGEVAFADAQVARLLAWLDSSGHAGRTIVAIASDHGEGLGDHGETTHGMLAYDSTLRVPLILSVPPRADLPPNVDLPPKGGSYGGPVSLADLAGTLLQAAGVAVPKGMRPGPLGASGEAYAETKYPESAGWHDLAVLAFDQWKAIVSSSVELYDVRADPRESRDLAVERSPVIDGARRRLAELRATRTPDAVAGAVPSDAADRLRALGYVSGAAPAPGAGAPNPARQIAAWNTFERELARLTAGDARGALPGLSRLARAHSESAIFQATYARALKDTGRVLQAVEIYRRLVARHPRDAAMYHDLAVAAAAAGLTAEATRAEQASLALQPSNAAASNGLGLILVAAGKPAEAIAAFERATQDDPSNAVFWSNLGNARRDAGDATRAEQAYRTALDRDPRSADAANGLGVLLVQQRRPADAIRWFEQALAGSPKFVEARLNLGIAYQEGGNRDKAIEAYRRVIADAPVGSKEYQAASQLLGSLGK
jgi:choline-sulfatase